MEEAVVEAQHWTYRGEIRALSFSPPGRIENYRPIGHTESIIVADAVISSPRPTSDPQWLLKWETAEEPCSDVVLPWHCVRLIEVDE